MTDKEKLIKIKSLADKMSDTAFNMTTDASLLRKAMDEYHQFIINEYHKEEQIIKELQEVPVSKELEKVANEWGAKASFTPFYMTLDDNGNPNGVKQDYTAHAESFKAGAKWQKENLWKPANGDDLPEIDREVVALLDNGKVVFAHRPPEYWEGKDIVTGKVTRNYPKTYDKGGWNIPNVKWWLDCSLPNMED